MRGMRLDFFFSGDNKWITAVCVTQSKYLFLPRFSFVPAASNSKGGGGGASFAENVCCSPFNQG